MAKGSKKHAKFHQKHLKKSKIEDEEIQIINKTIKEQAPPRGSNPLSMSNPEQPTFATARKFEDLPLSQYTKDALKQSKFISLTAIQRAALPHALAGRDVLGAAKTGSGKTLAFLIPLLECLYRAKWGSLDGLGALIISPTRELALQIFEELKKAGKYHEFSAGLLIGGKDVEEEAVRVAGLNILVSTPGRLLQHMDETPGFDASNMQVLVLDEADRILDMGFSSTLNAIIANLPTQRQTLLFSATQTKSVSSLARLSLKDPEYVSAHETSETPTPVRLDQTYMECTAGEKLNIIWSFIKTHLKSRTIVFLSTCKQVRFVYEVFRRLRPGTPLRALHGHMSQQKRLMSYQQFCDSRAGVLFATDIAARGLDFPSVDWVVQADCPEDIASYIHRVGRTARYTSSGKGLLLLLPSEKEGMVALLEEGKVPIRSVKHNPAKVQPVAPALQALLSKDAELKGLAQRALVSYLRSVFLQPNKKVFDVMKVNVEELAAGMGLMTIPKLRFLKNAKRKNVSSKSTVDDDDDSDSEGRDGSDDSDSGSDDSDDSGDAMNNNTAAIDHQDDGDDLLVIKRRNIYNSQDDDNNNNNNDDPITTTTTTTETTTKNKKKKPQKINPNRPTGTRIVFDDEGQEIAPLELLAKGGIIDNDDDNDDKIVDGVGSGAYASVHDRAAAAQAIMAQRDVEDRKKVKEMRKMKRMEKRAKRLAREGAGGSAGVVLANTNGDDYSDENSEDDYSGGDYSGGDYSGGDSDDDSGSDDYNDDDGDLDLLMDSDDDNKQERKNTKKHKVNKKKHGAAVDQDEVAHMDMVPVKKKQKKGGSMSLAEQEALALHLLRQK